MSGTLNTGWPLDAPGADGRLRFATGPDALREALWNLLMTSPGERLMQPAFGAGLATRIGQPNTQTTRQLIASEIAKTIAAFEARVSVTAVEVTPDPDDPAQVQIVVRYAERGVAAAPIAALSLALSLGSA